MAKNIGDLPLMVNNGTYHITISGSECLCGCDWKYGMIDRMGKSQNIIFRSFDAVTCEKCRELYLADKK